MTQQTAEVVRMEHKYLLSADQASALQHRLGRALAPDPHNGPLGYRVKSLYFDSPCNRDYLEKEAGIFHRKKLRLRLYDEDATFVLLERKEKRGDCQVKVSLPLLPLEARCLANGDLTVLQQKDDAVAASLYNDLVERSRPVVLIEYRRTAFCWPVYNTRITLDREVRYTEAMPDLFCRHPAYYLAGHGRTVTLEVKYDRALEPFIAELLRPYCGARLSYGKYEHCRQSLWAAVY